MHTYTIIIYHAFIYEYTCVIITTSKLGKFHAVTVSLLNGKAQTRNQSHNLIPVDPRWWTTHTT